VTFPVADAEGPAMFVFDGASASAEEQNNKIIV